MMGVAPGLGGRIWVMWGQDGKPVAVTRSNKAVTRFEPIQRVDADPFTLYRLSGDGRLGPLDMFIDQIPSSKKTIPPAGTFYTRVLPELSSKISVTAVNNKSGQVIARKPKTTMTDAGDPVASAKVASAGKSATTNTKGVVILKLTAPLNGKISVKITDPGYQALTRTIKL